jgi:hypothetical protein
MNRRGQNRLTPALAQRAADLLKAQADTEIATFGVALSEWLAADDPRPLEWALGVACTTGTNWRRLRRIDHRNSHVRAYAEVTGETPREIAARWKRYYQTAWPRHRQLVDAPVSIANTATVHLWFALKASPSAAPLAERQIARVIAASVCHEQISPTAESNDIRGERKLEQELTCPTPT